MSDSLSQPFSILRCLIKGLVNSFAIVFEKSSMNHEIKLTIFQNSSAFTSIGQHCYFLLLVTLYSDMGVNRVIIASNFFIHSKIPSWPVVEDSFLFFQTIRISEEGLLVDDVCCKIKCYFLPDLIVNWNAINVSFHKKSVSIYIICYF